MANVLRLKLQALYGPRLLAFKALDPSHVSLKCYGGSALLEDSCNSTLHDGLDGDSKGANGGGHSGRKDNEVEEALKDSNVDKLTSSICDKLRAKANVARGETDTGSVLTREMKKADKGDPFQQVVSTVRSMVLKNKAKAAAGDKTGMPKTENEEQQKVIDMDLHEAEGAFGKFGGCNGSNKDLQTRDMFGKSSKQNSSQSPFSHQQKSKDTVEALSFLNSLDDTTPLSSSIFDEDFQTEISNKKALSFAETDDSSDDLSSFDRKPRQSKNAMPDSRMPSNVKSKSLKGKDTALPQAGQGSSRAQSISKNTTSPGMSGLKATWNEDAPFAQPHGKIPPAKEAVSSAPSHQDNSIPRTGYMVCIQNLPSSCNPAAIKSAMANHGEVRGLFKKQVRNEFFNVYIEFKTEQSMEAALAARKLQIGSKSFLIVRTDKIFSTVVRLCRVHIDTTDTQMLSTCKKFGSIDYIKKRINGIYDVFYDVKELPNMTRILASLNEVTFNHLPCVAAPAPLVHPSAQNSLAKSPEGQAWHSFQVNQALNRIESGIDGMVVNFEDLKELTALAKEYLKG